MAGPQTTLADDGPMKVSCLVLLMALFPTGSAPFNCLRSTGGSGLLEVERRGCCSHHGGVCGCENGRALCCDGKEMKTGTF